MPLPLTFRIFLPFALGYYFSYLYRNINAVIAPDLVRDLGLSAASLGLLTGAYLIAFAAFQLPLGILLDRIGARRTEATLLLVAAAGAVVFASASSLTWLIVGRALIGLGVSACLMASFRAFVDWFSPSSLPLANGFVFAAGSLGAMSATVPIEAALNFTDWRLVFYMLAGLTLLISVLLYLIVPERTDRSAAARETTFRALVRSVYDVFRHPTFLRLAPLSALTQGTGIAVLGLWLGPWLRDVGGLSRGDTAQRLFWAAAAMAAGYLIQGACAERLGRRGWQTETIGLIGMGIFLIVQLIIMLGVSPAPIAIWFVWAFFLTSGGVIYAGLNQSFTPELTGRVNTALNLLVFLSAFAAQWGIGVIINLWPITSDGRFAAEGYQAALATILAIQLLGMFWQFSARRIWPSESTALDPRP